MAVDPIERDTLRPSFLLIILMIGSVNPLLFQDCLHQNSLIHFQLSPGHDHHCMND